MREIVYPYPIQESKLNGGNFEYVDFGIKKYKIKLPNKVKIGDQLRLRGIAGDIDESFMGQDLILLLKKEISNFHSVKRDIIMDLPIDLDLYNIAVVKRVNIGDRKFDVKIPGRLDYGNILRLRGKAEILNGGYPGDVLLRIAHIPNLRYRVLHRIFANFSGFESPASERKFTIKFKLPWLFEYSDEFLFKSSDSNFHGKYMKK